MDEIFDEIDISVLTAVEEKSGCQQADIIKSLRESGRSDSTVGRRIRELDVKGAVQLDTARERRKVFVIITGYGKDILKERRDSRPPKGGKRQ